MKTTAKHEYVAFLVFALLCGTLMYTYVVHHNPVFLSASIIAGLIAIRRAILAAILIAKQN